jgi:putative aldouronate transport system substrate-binding protein
MYEMQNTEQQAVITAVAAPKVDPEDTVKIRANNFRIGGYITVSADCEYPEIALKWLDYLFSEEGALLCNYGIEGETFEYNAEGKPEFNDTVKNNPNGLSFSQAMAYYTMPPSCVCLQDWTRELSSVPAKDILSYDIWGVTTTENNIPAGVTMTSDESKEYAKIMADITALVNEKTNHFITGIEPLENFGKFVEQIESLGIERAIAIRQAALDRFLSR